MKRIPIKDFHIGEGEPLTVISGPCVIESREHALATAEHLKNLFSKFDVNFIYKSSFDKANRSSIHSFRGPGLEKGLEILAEVKTTLDLPITSDIHTPLQAVAAADVVDIMQIPAFLCRQTDLLFAAGKTGSIINVKKGQFMAPWDMENVVKKVVETGNDKIILTERGASFGYNYLVSDMRSIPIMQGFGYPVCFDASHSTQLPGGLGASSGGQREYIPTLAKSAIAAGANVLFIESHPSPQEAKSDATSVMHFDDLETLLEDLVPLYNLCSRKPSFAQS